MLDQWTAFQLLELHYPQCNLGGKVSDHMQLHAPLEPQNYFFHICFRTLQDFNVRLWRYLLNIFLAFTYCSCFALFWVIISEAFKPGNKKRGTKAPWMTCNIGPWLESKQGCFSSCCVHSHTLCHFLLLSGSNTCWFWYFTVTASVWLYCGDAAGPRQRHP